MTDSVDPQVEWVVFDLGDVVLAHSQAFATLAGLLAADPGRLEAAYEVGRRGYETDSDPARYWTGVARHLGLPEPEPEVVRALVEADDRGWNVVHPDVWRLVEDLRDAGVRLAVLSNAPASMGRIVESSDWSTAFEYLLFSGDLGIIKPDPAIFAELLRRLGAQPSRVAFVDDRPDNIEGARTAGIHGIGFTDADSARADLRRLGLPV
ncbi:HAD family hydrolase [Nakamurella endophytica]|uniref:Haloacid dehalogenase n=1 Tax=Nakamurella endophytica TaxID=1748367 RepID=A0A917WJ27_9ACTN|nr:HAD family phosphatase [Nakamurella endophytica]GGM08766.1 haloacid dehalogenase [Nakamurella endophytica]